MANGWGSKEQVIPGRLGVLIDFALPILVFVAFIGLLFFVAPQFVGLLHRDGIL